MDAKCGAGMEADDLNFDRIGYVQMMRAYRIEFLKWPDGMGCILPGTSSRSAELELCHSLQYLHQTNLKLNYSRD